MKSLRKIFRSEEFRQGNAAVPIPDLVVEAVKPEPPKSAEGAEAPDEEQLLRERMRRELTRDIRREQERILAEERARIMAEITALRGQTEQELAALRQQAQADAAQQIRQAQSEADDIRLSAQQSGYADGVQQRIREIDEAAAALHASMEALTQELHDYEDEYAKELRGLALEISEKLVCQKLDEDDEMLLRMIKGAIKPLRDASWIRVDISDAFRERANYIQQSLTMLRPDQRIEVEIRREAPKGTCVIQTADGVTVASVMTQLENIRSYFKEFEEDEQMQSQSGAAAPEHAAQ